MSKKKFHVQPVDLSTMEVVADYMEIEHNGVSFFSGEEVVFFAPNANTKYVTEVGYSSVRGKQR